MNIALVLAAGSGSRMNCEVPKQFLEVNNKPLLVYTLEAFNQNEKIDYILLVTNEAYISKTNDLVKQYGLNKVKFITKGGSTRQESVYNGLVLLKDNNVRLTDTILIHDCARVLISQDIIDNNILACDEHDAAVTVIPSQDTILRSIDKKTIDEVQKRDEQFIVQTPQTFKYGIIKYAHDLAIKENFNETTDDAKLVLKYGHDVHLVMGNKLNFKVTTIDDLNMLKALL